MDATVPIRSPAKTYLQRTKPKRTKSKQVDSKSDASSDTSSQHDATARSMKPLSRQSGKVTSKPADSPSLKSISTKQISRKVDLRDVPGPSPKRVRRNSDDGSEKNIPISISKSTKRSTHIRTSSASIISLNQVKVASSKPDSTRGNEASNSVKPTSKAASVSQSMGEDDEEASLADSFADSITSASGGGRISRTVKDRQEYYKNQSDCHTFGPYRAICSRCKQVVNLVRRQTYAVGPWERHRAKCDQELASDSPLPPNADELVNASVDEIFPEYPARRSATERRAVLVADKYIETAEEERVKCAKCEKWIALRKGTPYDLSKWKLHRNKCSPESASDRDLFAERKLAIVNDPLVKSFDAAATECAECGTKVVGKSGQDYDIAAWEDHKVQCRSHYQTGASDPVNSISFPSRSSAKPPSTASTEVTVVAAEPAANGKRPTSQSMKRPREEDTEDERPYNRPRSENYETPVKEPPSVMGWFMLPFKSFARGFRESLKTESS